MSVKISGSDKRLALRLPGEGKGWKRQGDEMVEADAGGGGGGLLLLGGYMGHNTAGDGSTNSVRANLLTQAAASARTANESYGTRGIPVPAGTLKNLFVDFLVGTEGDASTKDVTVTVYVNGVASALVVTLHASGTGNSGETEVAVVAGDLVQLKAETTVNDSGDGLNVHVSASVQLELGS
jgi:hypothetical protein